MVDVLHGRHTVFHLLLLRLRCEPSVELWWMGETCNETAPYCDSGLFHSFKSALSQ
jgi:hypothetical protein